MKILHHHSPETGLHKSEIGYRFHRGLAEAIVDVARRLREQHGLTRVALSGGVFQNRVLLRLIMKKNPEVIVPSGLVSNDSAIPYGQAIAALKLKTI